MSSNPARTVSPLLPSAGSALDYPDMEVAALPAAEPPCPPVARLMPRAHTIHGETRLDNYAWLRDRGDPAVIAYLEAENSYTATIMRPTEALQERLYQEMRGRIKETDLSVPERVDQYFYYTRTEAGRQYPILCRRQESLEASEEILLDQNLLA